MTAAWGGLKPAPDRRLRRAFRHLPYSLLRRTMSRPGESHPQPLVERYVNLSTHTAPIRRTHRSSRRPSGRHRHDKRVSSSSASPPGSPVGHGQDRPTSPLRSIAITATSSRSGRRRRPSKGSPPSAAQTVRAVFPHTAFTRLPGGREMEGINEWTFCSPVGLSQSASLLGRSLLGLSHKELIRAIGLTHSRPAVSPTTLPTDFPSPPGCRSRGRTAFTARQVLFGRPTPRTTSPSTSPSDL